MTAQSRAVLKEEDLSIIDAPEPESDEITLNSLRAGEQPFSAWSYANLKVVRAGKQKTIKVPIKSIGIIDIIERLARSAPTPPRKTTVLRKDSPEGRSLGLKHDRMVEIEDQLDEKYRKENRDFEINSAYKIVLHGLAMDILSDAGVHVVRANDEHSATEVLDETMAIDILKKSGLTHDHIQQLAKDIKNLTYQEEARIDQE